MRRQKKRFLSAVARKETSRELKYEEIGTAYIPYSMDNGSN
jgi:hypothetical protein